MLSLQKQNYDLSNLVGKTKADVEKTGKKQLLNIFSAIDTNKDLKLDNKEVSVFVKNIQIADFDKNGDISQKELKKLLKSNSDFAKNLLAMGKVKALHIINFISQLTDTKNYAQATATKPEYVIQNRTVEDTQQSAIEMIQDEVDNGYEIFEGHSNGVFAKTYNELRECFGAKLTESAVAKNLFIKNETAELLRRAKAGTLTRSEYYNIIKENLMQTFPGVEKMSQEELQKLADMINSLSPERIEQMQKKILALPSPDSEDYETLANDFVLNFVRETCVYVSNSTVINNDGIVFSELVEKFEPNSPYAMENGNKLMSFNEVYEIRNGVKFDPKKVEKYNQLKTQYSVQKSFNELQAHFHNLLDGANSDTKAEKAILELISSLSQAQDDETMTKILSNLSGMKGVLVVNGKIITDDIQALKKAILAKIDSQVNEINGGKTFEEITVELEQTYKEAYGEENVELLAKAYVQEQEKFVKNTRRVLEIGGAAASVIGMFCCPALAIGAGIVGAFGGVGFEMLEEATKDSKSKEKIDALKKELALNAALFATGLGSGAVGSIAGTFTKTLATKCPTLLSFIAERGTDATLSLISTLAITGELDLEGVALSQVLAVVSGVASAKVGVKNAVSEPENLSIVAPNYHNPSVFGRFFGPRDINPNSPLNKYKPSKSSYNDSHGDFHAKNPHLFKGNELFDCWSEHIPSDRHHGPWKMHLYSVSEEDWQRMADVIIPYLRDNDIEWKTFGPFDKADCLNGSHQQGKAFTIYPKNNAEFEKIARDLDYIIRNNNLNTTNTNIEGDRALGSSGRIFYRYEFESGKYKDDVLDLTKEADCKKYDRIYDSNAYRKNRNGVARHIPEDMTPADDPWYNFDPAKSGSVPKQKINSDYTNTNTYDMIKDSYYQVRNNTKLHLPDGVVIDFSDSYIRQMIARIPEGGSATIGRSSECFIRIKPECTAVSRVHLVIYKQNGCIYVRDVSSNGSKIQH